MKPAALAAVIFVGAALTLLLPSKAKSQPIAQDTGGEIPFMIRFDAADCQWAGTAENTDRLVKIRGASKGTCVKVKPDCEIFKPVSVPLGATCYVYVRCPAREETRLFSVQLGQTASDPVCVSDKKATGWRWARVGPFKNVTFTGECRLSIRSIGGFAIFIDQVAITPSPDLRSSPDPVQTFPDLKFWGVPGPEVLEDCKRLDVDPPAYMTEHFIIQAPPEYITRAVGWVKYVEANIYPTMIQMLGSRPQVDLYAVMFRDDYPKHPAVYSGIAEFEKTGYRAHRIRVRCYKLDWMPPYQFGGSVTWETMHALLNDAKKQADWKPIWQTELLDLIFEMELFKRFNMQSELDKLLHGDSLKDPRSRYAVFAEFWKEYGWQPFQKLIVKLHDNPEFKPTLDEGTFAYEMSLGAGKDVSAFFETRGWKIPPETKARITEQLSHNEKAREGKPQ